MCRWHNNNYPNQDCHLYSTSVSNNADHRITSHEIGTLITNSVSMDVMVENTDLRSVKLLPLFTLLLALHQTRQASQENLHHCHAMQTY